MAVTTNKVVELMFTTEDYRHYRFLDYYRLVVRFSTRRIVLAEMSRMESSLMDSADSPSPLWKALRLNPTLFALSSPVAELPTHS